MLRYSWWWTVNLSETCRVYTGCFTTLGHNCRRWFPRSLWWKKFIETCVRFWTVTELWPFFNSRTRPRVNRVLQLAGSLVANFSQLQTVQFPLSRHLVGMRWRWGGLVFAWRCLTQLHNARSSQPRGSLCCGRRWHFRKPALSTDKFKLKVISRT